jgi:hypothetical protein
MKELIEAYEKVKAGAESEYVTVEDGTTIRVWRTGDNTIRIVVRFPPNKLPRRQIYEN